MRPMPALPNDAAEAMDRNYRYQRLIYDATRKWYLLGRDELLEEMQPAPGMNVLEIGCGTGRNLVAAAKLYPDARLHGLDISREMLDTATKAIGRAGLGARVRLAQGDATDFSTTGLFGKPGFERVYVSYALSMIPDWRAALEQAVLALAPGGRLHLVDFGQQQGLPRWFRTMLYAWLAHWHVHPDAGLEQALADLAWRHGLSLRIRHPRRGYTIAAVLTRAG